MEITSVQNQNGDSLKIQIAIPFKHLRKTKVTKFSFSFELEQPPVPTNATTTKISNEKSSLPIGQQWTDWNSRSNSTDLDLESVPSTIQSDLECSSRKHSRSSSTTKFKHNDHRSVSSANKSYQSDFESEAGSRYDRSDGRSKSCCGKCHYG